MTDDFDYEKLTRALDGALPTAAILAFVEAVRRMTPERRRNVGRIMRGRARWNDWLGDGSLSADLTPPRYAHAFIGLEIITKHPPCEYLAPPRIEGPIVSFEVGGVMMTAVEDPKRDDENRSSE